MPHLYIIFAMHILCGAAGYNMKQGIPYLDPNEWWGPAELKGYKDTSIRPFRIEFKEEMIRDLRGRLNNYRNITPGLEGANFRYGFNSDSLYGWLKYWADDYPFAEREALLNTYPQYKTRIQGLDIHFIWIRSQVPPRIEVVPLLMLHGWPGSVREFYEAIPFITEVSKNRDFAVELIVASLPGFGFSDGAVRPGLGPAQIAVVFRNLMRRLGHKRFYLQGGDYGSIINSALATLFPEEVLGFHTNFPVILTPTAAFLHILGSIYPPLIVDPALAHRMYPLSEELSFLMEESGYLHEQATKPDTIGVALSDSPAGLLAYILEKFSSATEVSFRDLPDGGLSNFNPNSLIDNLMMYWTSNCITTAIRIYAETFNKKQFLDLGIERIPTPVPTWALQARNELLYQPPIILKTKYRNLINTTVLDYGGHFFAFQLPKVFSENVLNAIVQFRRWHKGHQMSSFVKQDNVNWNEFFEKLDDEKSQTNGQEIFYLLLRIVQKLVSYH